MKKLLVTLVASATMMFSGCDMSESQLIATANTTGTIAMLTWFAVDNPDTQVKSALKVVIGNIEKASVDVGSGKTYLESVLPGIQEIVIQMHDINEYQKALINGGAVVVLHGIDTYLDKNPEIKTNVELVNKVDAAFCKGCLTVLKMEENAPEIMRTRGVYQLRSMKCRGGKFVTPEVK